MDKRKSNFADKVRSNQERQKNNSGNFYSYLNLPKDVNMFKPQPGEKAFIDIIPYEVTDAKHMDHDEANDVAMPGTLWYKKPILIHRNVGAEKATVICPKTIGKPCPICEYREKRKQEDAGDEELNSMNRSRRNLYIVIPIGMKRDKKSVEEVPHIMDIAQDNFEKQLGKEIEEKPKYANFPALEDGYTLEIRFDEDSIGKNKFAVAGRIDFNEREKGYKESILDDVPNLDEIVKIESYTSLRRMFFELDEEEEETHSSREERKERTAEREERSERRERSSEREERSERNEHKRTLEKEEEKEEKNESLSWEELSEMGLRRMKRFVEENELNIRVKKYEDDEDGLREAIAEELGIKKPKEHKEERSSKSEGKKSDKKGGDPECPAGMEFGTDFGKNKKCDSCALWDACMDANSK